MTENARSELKGCPFCASMNVTLGYRGQPAQWVFFACADCGAAGPPMPRDNVNADSWNKRPLTT